MGAIFSHRPPFHEVRQCGKGAPPECRSHHSSAKVHWLDEDAFLECRTDNTTFKVPCATFSSQICLRRCIQDTAGKRPAVTTQACRAAQGPESTYRVGHGKKYSPKPSRVS